MTETISRPERRALPRFEYFARVVGGDPANTESPFFEGRISNLSLNGVGLLLYRPLVSNSTVYLTLHHAMGIYQCSRAVRVIDSRCDDQGGWTVNCEFLRPLSTNELRLFQVQDLSPR